MTPRMRVVSRNSALALALLSVLLPHFGFASSNDPFRGGREAVNPKPSVGAGQSTGAMTYTYPFAIPPGRNGMQPDISLNYSSDDKRQDSPFGYGWSMNLPYIERVNKLGTNNLYNQDADNTFFTSSLSGELFQVVSTTPIGGSFLGFSLTTPRFALLDTPSTYADEPSAEYNVTPDPQPTAVISDSQKVSADVARSFHTFVDTFLPSYVYHPNEWEDWFVARDQAKEEAKRPISGFPVAERKIQRTQYAVIPTPLAPFLETLPASDRATIKGEAIARLGPIAKTRQGDYQIEVTSMEPIDGGVQVFAKAWDANDNQIGFGHDGSVDIERFRIFNPPILVDDERGDIIHRWTDIRGEPRERHLREDLREALLQVLAHTIAVKQERFDSLRIIPGKVGNTTDVYYPSSDGSAERNSANSTWSSLRSGNGTTNVTFVGAYFEAGATTDRFSRLWRGQLKFDTSALPDSDTISSATLSLYGDFKQDSLSNTPDADVYSGPTTSLANSDFENSGSTALASAIAYSSWSTSGYNDFALNGSGITNISLTGSSGFSLRNVNKDVNDVQPAWAVGSHQTGVVAFGSLEAGTSKDPKLTVEHGAGTSVPSAPTNLLVDGLTNPSNIATTSPYFSAIHVNASTTALATSYQIQIDTTGAFTSLYWDSGKKTLSSSTPQNQRTPDVFSTTTFALDGTKYYWRVRLWDGGTTTPGAWSAGTDSFVMQIAGDYMAKVDDGSMMRYTLNTDGYWTAYDKRGWKYTFGALSNSRISDPNDSAKIYRWYLNEIEDPNGNKILYRYTKDGGQVYPDYIDYTDRAGGSLAEVDFTKDLSDVTGWPVAPFATSSMYGFSVFTKYLISDIEAKVNGITVRRFTPSYTTGDNSNRLMLAGITEKGYRDSDGTGALTFPPTNFTYQTSTTTWTEVTDPNSWIMNFDVSDTSNNDYGWRPFDMNGDALPDWVRSDAGTQAVLLNTGSKWSTSTAWTIPVAFAVSNAEQGVRMAEVNGDGLIDLIAASSTKVVYLNNGTSTWTASTTWSFPVSFVDSGNRDQGVQVADLNGDGLTDILQAHYASTTGTTSAVYLNNGHGWTHDTGWTVPEVLINDLKDPAIRLYDYNGDGLVDIIYAPYPYTVATDRVYFNTGRGWTRDTAGDSPLEFAEISASIGSADRGVRFADFNSDGCVDMAQGLTSITKRVYVSDCQDSWLLAAENTLPEYFRDTVSDYGTRMDDIDGDGLLDITRSFYDSGSGARTRKVYLKNGNIPDLLREVTSSRKGKTTAGYQGSAEYKDGAGNLLNPNLPFVSQTVRTLATDNGSYITTGRVIATTTYDYQRGYYYGTNTPVLDRKFAGFGLVVATTTTSNVTKSYFHQGNGTDSTNGEFGDHISKAGRPYRTELYDQSGNLFSRTINKWARADYGDGRNFVKLAQTLTQIFDGDLSHRDTAASTTYNDTTGNISVLVSYGEVAGNSDGTFTDTGTDLASTTYSYAASSTLATMSLPSRELLADQSGTTVKDTKWYYDSLAADSVSYGNQTKEERLISGSTYASTTRTFNTYGLVSTSTDPLGNASGVVYDGYNLLPITFINAQGHTKLVSYDYSSGKAATTTDENNQTFAVAFDNLDRPKEEKQPDFSAPSTLVFKTTYTYTDSTTTPSAIQRTDYLSSATTTDSYTYLDGFDRTIQAKREAESANGWITKDTLYNSIGSVDQESLPYWSTVSTYSTPTTTTALFVTNRYDATGRVLTTANAVGTTTNSYVDWRLTVTDSLGNRKDLNKDAYGNLASVVEYPSAGATTTYAWNLLGKLTKITDASSNIRNFTYDNLGRLTGSEDLHASGDTTFGTTSRQYDLAGNLIQVFTPRGNTISYAYDTLNRVLTEDATTTATGLTDVIYRYDTCANGKGRVCEINANNAATTTYVYNPIGLGFTEAKQIGTTWATTSTSHLRTGAVDTLTYPTGHQIAYAYNDAGDLNRVLGLSVGSTTWNTLVESTTYGPHGKPTAVDYGNNTKTTYTYDATNLYRLTRKLTLATSTTSGSPETLLFLAMALKTSPMRLLALLEGANQGEALVHELLPINDATTTPGSFTEAEMPPLLNAPDAQENNSLSETIVTNLPVPDVVPTSTPQIEPSVAPTELLTENPTTSSLHFVIPDSVPVSIDVPTPLTPTLATFSPEDRANLKGQAIARLGSVPKTRQGDYQIEVTSMEPVDGGIQVFAKAWDANGNQIGFGRDGSVEIERFRIMNPPIFIPDGTKRTILGPDGTTEHQVDNFKEDLRAALLTSLEHTIKVKKEKFDDARIISGKVGNTTSTFYPSDGAYEDGAIGARTTGSYITWASLLTQAGDGNLDGGSCFGVGVLFEENGAGTGFSDLYRGRSTFDTSSLPDSDAISSATLSLYGDCKQDYSSIDIGVYGFSTAPASNSALSNSDYDRMNSTAQSGTTFTASSWSTSAYNDFALNATGLGNISKTAASHFSVRDVTHDVGATAPSDFNSQALISAYAAEQGGTTNDPKLVVEHSAAASGPSAPTNLLTNALTNPSNIATTSPYFSAIHVNASTTALATDYQIQIDTAGTFTSPYWDSGKKTLSSSTPQSMRTPDIFSTTTFALDGTKYYWRIKFWDQTATVGEWSTSTAWFKMRAASTILQDLNYEYDLVGNILTIQDYSGHNGAASTSYQYDNLYRLTRASTTDAVTSNWLQTYAYNDIGNITSKSDIGSYTYGGTGFINPHAPTQVGSTNYSYDNAGNLTSAGSQTFTWDPWNRLAYTSLAGTTTHYAYDHAGQRVQQDINRGSGTTSTLYFNRYYETSVATTTLYIFMPNGDLLGTIEGNGVSTTTSITHADHLNSSSVMSDKNGALSQLATFYPFGGLRNNELPSSGIRQDRLFLSQYTDEATSLNYLNARYENPTNGQFLSQDPMFTGDPNNQALNNPQSLNSYSYAENNPIGKSDPSGKCPHCLIGAGAGMLGQYGIDVYNNIQAGGFSAGALYQNLSSPETYLVRAGQGAIIAGTGGLAGAMGLGLVGQSVAVGTASGLTSMGASKYLEGSINYKSAAVDAVVGAATFGAVGSVARVPGRLPNFGTNAFFTGAHTQQSALNLGIDAGASYVSSVVGGSFSQSNSGSTPSNMRTSNSTPQMTQSSYQAQLDSISAQIKVIQQQINQLAKSMGKK